MVFDLRCGTKMEFAKKTMGDGHEYYIYKYRSPPEGCFTTSVAGYQRAYPVHGGLVSIAYPSGDLLQVKDRPLEFPEAYPILQRDETVTWGLVEIDNTPHRLPLSFEKLMLIKGQINRVQAKYLNHRHFEGASSVSFK